MNDRGDRLRREAERIRASGSLGRSEPLVRLFDYLVAHIDDMRAPKEIEVAQDVFQRDGAFDPAVDPAVRVTVHRLRRKLEQYYREEGTGSVDQLSIPKGEYRFHLTSVQAENASEYPSARRWPGLGRWAFAGIAGLLALAMVAAALIFAGYTMSTRGFRSSAYQGLVSAQGSKIVVLGAGYMFGEKDASGQVKRVVHEFGIDSFDQIVAASDNREIKASHTDFGNAYIPFPIVSALFRLLPALAATTPENQLSVLPVAELNNDVINKNHVIYVGRFDDLGFLSVPVMARSGFNYDSAGNALIDRATGRRYSSPRFDDRSKPQRDFAYIMSFPSLHDHHALILTGLSYGGAMKASEVAVSPEIVRMIHDKVGDDAPFEALLVTMTVKGESLGQRLLIARKLPNGRLREQ